MEVFILHNFKLFTVMWMFLKEKIKKQYVIIFLGILIISDMWSVDKRYLNETHFVDQVNSSIKLSTQEKDIHKLIYQKILINLEY